MLVGTWAPSAASSVIPAAQSLFRQALLALLLVTLAIPAASPAGNRELPLQEQVGQLIVMSFKGTAAPQYVLTALRERRAAGVILFGGNVESPRQLRTLTAALRSGGGSPLVAVDQEGGEVRVLPWAPPSSSAPEQAAAGTVGRDARRAGLVLRRAGVNVSLAPVADVPSVAGSALASRSFSSDPKRTSTAVAAAVAGWSAGGVAATAKHFPGLGAATVNTDDGKVTIRRSRAEADERGPASVRSRDPRGRPTRDGLPRALHSPGSTAHRVAVSARSSRASCATDSASAAS